MYNSVHTTIDLDIGAFTRIAKYPVDFNRPETHARMLRNRSKYRLFSDALASVVRGKTVLDIGTGSGILALLSYAHGAKRVVAIDREPVSEMTKAVLHHYRLDDAVEIVGGDVFDLDLGDRKFDVIVSETIGYLGFEENIAVILSYAGRQWGHDQTVFLPSDIGVWAEPIRLSSVPMMPFLTCDREAMPNFERIDSSVPVALGTAEATAEVSMGVWQATRAVNVNAVAVYFDAGLGSAPRITNKDNPNWPYCIVPLRQPVSVHKGESLGCRLRLTASADESYRVSLRVQNRQGKAVQETAFESSEIESSRVPAAPNTVAAVVGEVENVLRELSLFAHLSRSHGVAG